MDDTMAITREGQGGKNVWLERGKFFVGISKARGTMLIQIF